MVAVKSFPPGFVHPNHHTNPAGNIAVARSTEGRLFVDALHVAQALEMTHPQVAAWLRGLRG